MTCRYRSATSPPDPELEFDGRALARQTRSHNTILWKDIPDHGINNHLSVRVNVYDGCFAGMW